MRRQWILVGILAIVLFGAATESPAPFIWNRTDGWRKEQDVGLSTPNASWRQAEEYRSEGRRGEAIRGYRRLIKKWPDNSLTPRARRALAEVYEEDAHLFDAFEVYQELLEKHPDSVDFPEILRRQFEIGQRLFDGERQRFLGIRALPAVDKAAEVFRKVVENGPYSDIAPNAQFGVGATLEKRKEYREAAAAYRKVVDHYPDSEIAAEARYRLGVCYYRLSSDAPYDQDASREAVSAFSAFLVHFPDHDKAAVARQLTEELWNRQAEGIYRTAAFYESQRETESAVIYYGKVVEEYPETQWARQASEAIARLRPAEDPAS